MRVLQGYLLCVETQRCRNIFEDESDNGERNSGTRSCDDKYSHQGGLSLNEDFHAAVMSCSDTQTGGGGQIKNTSSSPQKTARTGTQSRGTSTSNTASGVGGSEPPEDGRGKPLIPGHYSASKKAEEEDDDSTSKDESKETASSSADASSEETSDHAEGLDTIQNPGSDAGVACNGCTKSPQSCKIFFTGDKSDDVFTALRVYCSKKCAENAQMIVSVNLWELHLFSQRRSLELDEQARQHRRRQLDDENRRLAEADSFEALFPVAEVEESRPPVFDPNYRTNYVSLPPMFDSDDHETPAGPPTEDFHPPVDESSVQQELHLFSQRRSLELDEQARQHRRRQLDDENRRLAEADSFEALFPVAEVEESRPPVFDPNYRTNYVSLPPMFDSDDHETPAGPPTEDFHPPVDESSVQQDIDYPEEEEEVSEQESHQPQEIQAILPAHKESEEEDDDDDDEGVQVISTGMNEEES